MRSTSDGEDHEPDPFPDGDVEAEGEWTVVVNDAGDADEPSTDPHPSDPRPSDPAERDGQVGSRPPPNAWAASMDWEASLEQLFAKEEERERKAGRLRRLRGWEREVVPRRSYPLDVGEQRGASPPLTVRLPRWLDVQIRQEFERSGASVSAGLRQVLEEWWVTRRYPALEFREPDFLRLASIRNGPGVAEWASASPRPPLGDDVLEQVLDYVELFRSRLRR